MKKLLWIGLATLVALLGCNLMTRDFYRTEEDFPENGKGMLVLVLDGSNIATHTIAPPDGTMDILSYRISGYRNSSAVPSFSDDKNVGELEGGSVYSRNDLLPGTWEITIIAYNELGGGDNVNADRIGFGSIPDLFVSPNAQLIETVSVGPDTGVDYTGTLNLTVSWAPSTVPDPLIVANLIAGTSGTENVPLSGDFNFDNEDTEVTLNKSGLIAGYYTLSIDVYKDDTQSEATLVMGDDVAVRIVSEQTSIGTFDLSSTPGNADITITPDLNNPIDITMNLENPITAGGVMTATLQAAPDGSYFTYDWYVDGAVEQEGSSATPVLNDTSDILTSTSFTPELGTTYRISVVVTEYDYIDSSYVIASISSETYIFTTVEIDFDTTSWPPDADVTLIDPPTDSYFTYDWYEDGSGTELWGNNPPELNKIIDTYNSTTGFTTGEDYTVSVVVTEYLGSTLDTEIATISSYTHTFTAP